MTNEECRTALKRIAGYMCAKKDLEALTHAMNVLEYISSELEKNSKKLENNIGELDCISRKRAIERLKLNLPISDGADNSRDRHRYMQSLADIQAIRELPSVTPQEPSTKKLQAESDKIDAAFQDGYNNGYAQARFDYEQEPILDKIRAEIEKNTDGDYHADDYCDGYNDGMKDALVVIDKYKAEIKTQESEAQDADSD